MISLREKKVIIPGSIILGALIILGLLLYYQRQGILKIFPTREDREIKRILKIDRSKFRPANGLSQEQFEAEIKRLKERRATVLADPQNAQAWFDFGYTKEFLNDHEGAVASWEKSFALQPLNFVTTSNLANTYQYFLKDNEKAEQYYLKTLEIKPDYTLAYRGLLDLYRFNWREKQNLVEPLLLEAIANDAQNKLQYLASLVEFFVDHDLPKAKSYLRQVRELDPQQAAELLVNYPSLK